MKLLDVASLDRSPAAQVVGGAAVPHAARAAASLGGYALEAAARDYLVGPRNLTFASPRAAAAAAGVLIRKAAAVTTGATPAPLEVHLDPAWTRPGRRLG